MFCTNCGTENENTSKYCKNCGKALEEVNNTSNSNNIDTTQKNNMYYQDIPTFSPTHSIILLIVSLFCCSGGIIGTLFPVLSLVEGDKVKNLVDKGDIEGAKKAKKSSDNWIKATYIAFAVIALIAILYFCLCFFFAIASIN